MATINLATTEINNNLNIDHKIVVIVEENCSNSRRSNTRSKVSTFIFGLFLVSIIVGFALLNSNTRGRKDPSELGSSPVHKLT